MWKGHITDNHMHLDPINGLGLGAARQFEQAGGTDIILVGKTAQDWGISARRPEDFERAFQMTIDFSEKIGRETKARAHPLVGFHPSEFLGIAADHGIEAACEAAYGIMDVIEGLYHEGRIYGIGEVGRPHFEVDVDMMAFSNEIMMDFLRLSSDLNCPIQLHTEHFDEAGFDGLGKMLKRSGNPRKVIKHFSPPMPNKAEEAGVYPSIVSSKDSLLRAISESNRFLMETDYIDDLSRPGAVLGPKTVPKRTRQLLDSGIFTEEDVAVIHEDQISMLYGIDMD